MVRPPPFWSVAAGAAAVAGTGLLVTTVAPQQSVVGWVVVGLAVLAFLLYLGWLLIWAWRHRDDGDDDIAAGAKTGPPSHQSGAVNINVPGDNNTVIFQTVIVRLRKEGSEVIEEEGAKLTVSAVDDVLEIRDEVSAVVTRARVGPTGDLIVVPPAAEPLVDKVVRSVFAQAQAAIGVGRAFNANVRIEESATDPEDPQSPHTSKHGR